MTDDNNAQHSAAPAGTSQGNEERLRFLSDTQDRSAGMSTHGYTKLVRFLKLALPIIAVAIIAIIFTWPKMQAPDLPEPSENLVTANIEKNELIQPHFESQDDKNQPFTITAQRATQNVRNPDVVNLDKPMADMHLNSGSWLAIEAQSGQYRQKAESLLLEGDVKVFHDGGYEIKSDTLSINIKSRKAWSDKPVTGHGPEGTIDASGMQVDTADKSIVFTGPAKLTLYQDIDGIK